MDQERNTILLLSIDRPKRTKTDIAIAVDEYRIVGGPGLFRWLSLLKKLTGLSLVENR